MIKLDIREYCQDCTDFEPQVAHKPAQLAILSLNASVGGTAKLFIII